MPQLNGYQATKRIRELLREDALGIPIFAMTANAFREDKEKALKAGMNDIIVKPLDIPLLIRKIKNIRNEENGHEKIGKLFLVIIMGISLMGCQPDQKSVKKIVLTVKTPPIGVGNIPDIGEQEVYDFLKKQKRNLLEQYKEYDVEFKISKFNYQDEKTQLADKYGTDEAVDIFIPAPGIYLLM